MVQYCRKFYNDPVAEFFNYLKDDLLLPSQAAHQFLVSISENLIRSNDPLTGPLKRGDAKTIERHLRQLKNSPLEDVYKSFIKLLRRASDENNSRFSDNEK